MTEQHPPAPHAPAPHGHGPSEEQSNAMISNILGIVGLLVLAIIVIWGLFHLASLFGGGSSKSSNVIVVTAPTTVTAGEPTTISWKYTPKESGAFAILYQCTSGFQFTFSLSDQRAQIPCGAAYLMGDATSSVTVLPLLAGTSTVAVPVTIIYIPSSISTNSTPIQGTVTINVRPGINGMPTPVINGTKPTKPSTTSKTTKPSSGGGASATAGSPADLSVRLISVNVDPYGNGTAIFDIANIGGSVSAPYTFQAQLPTMQPYTYTSPLQAPLPPGSRIENTLRFTQAVPGLFSVTVSGDGAAAGGTASQYLSMPYGN